MKSYKVSVWKISVNKTTKRATYVVRWVVDGHTFGESHKTNALADRFRAKLLRAVDKGEPFDTVSGLPDSLRGGKPPPNPERFTSEIRGCFARMATRDGAGKKVRWWYRVGGTEDG